MDRNYNDEIEIDLFELLYAIKQKIIVILFASISGGIIAWLFSFYMLSPIYTSTTKLLVITKETTLASLADIQMGSQLTNDYQVLIKSRPVLEEVIEDLSLPMTNSELESKITINNPANTRILEIVINDTDAMRAAYIANDLADVASTFIGEQMEVIPPKIIEDAIVSNNRTSPNYYKNIIIGLFLGFIISTGIVCLATIMDDTIKTEEDITKYLEIPTLTKVPDRKDYINKKEIRKGLNSGRG